MVFLYFCFGIFYLLGFVSLVSAFFVGRFSRDDREYIESLRKKRDSVSDRQIEIGARVLVGAFLIIVGAIIQQAFIDASILR